ncbi:ATP-binding protein [Aquabacterium sp.]|uniref:ATP-binding protein n=1 Tax=Aquabacterium sp. TaxID=1872578 RepID=UPI003782F2AF
MGQAIALLAGPAAYYLLALGCVHLSRLPNDISTMWLPDGFASVWLLLQPRARRRWLLLAFAATIPLANLSYGDPWRVALSFVPANLLQIALSAWLIDRWVQPAQAVLDPLALARALALAGVLPALAGATLATLTVPVLLGTALGPSVGHLWLSWLVSTFFGVVTTLPLGLWVLARGPRFEGRFSLASLAALSVALAFCVAGPLWLPHAFAYVTVALVATALIGGFVVAAVAALLASAVLNAMLAYGLMPGASDGTSGALLTLLPVLLSVVPTALIGALREGLLEQLQRIRAGEALERSMLDASPALLGLLGADGRILRLNAAGAQLLGAAEPRQVEGRLIQDFVEPAGTQATVRTLDGRRLRAEQHRAPVRLADGEGATVLALRDISGELEMQRLREEAARIEADSRAKSEFLSRMSHELRTPLNAILGFAQVLEATLGVDSRERQREQLQHIQQAGWHLLAMIDDVLDLSRIDAAGAAPRPQPVALDAALAQASSMVQAEAQRKGVVIGGLPLPAAAWVVADPLRLRQVLINLLSNAVKYNRDGGQVQVSAGAEGAHWRLRVQDTGVGIAPAYQAQVFEPFNRLGQGHSGIPGTGIGLTITRRLVEAMGGSIGFESTPGVGSRFWFTLPAASPVGAVGAVGPMGAGAVPAHAEPGPLPRGLRVLCVEDQPANGLMLEQALALDGHQVRHAVDAEGALRLLREETVDLVLTDLQLPGASGLLLREWMRADPALAGIPCIALTAQALPADRAAAAELGFAAYIVKPVDLGLLRRTVASAVRG